MTDTKKIEEIVEAITAAYHAAGTDNVMLATIRDALGERYNRYDVDDALRLIDLTIGSVFPESNQKTLRQCDRDSVVEIGNQDKHVLWIGN